MLRRHLEAVVKGRKSNQNLRARAPTDQAFGMDAFCKKPMFSTSCQTSDVSSARFVGLWPAFKKAGFLSQMSNRHQHLACAFAIAFWNQAGLAGQGQGGKLKEMK